MNQKTPEELRDEWKKLAAWEIRLSQELLKVDPLSEEGKKLSEEHDMATSDADAAWQKLQAALAPFVEKYRQRIKEGEMRKEMVESAIDAAIKAANANVDRRVRLASIMNRLGFSADSISDVLTAVDCRYFSDCENLVRAMGLEL